MLFKFLKFDRNKGSTKAEASSSVIEPPENVGSSSSELAEELGSTLSGMIVKVDGNQQWTSDDQNKVNGQTGMTTRLEDEFRIILNSLTNPTGTNSRTDPTSTTDSTTGYEDYRCGYGAKIKSAIDDLRRIAERMNSSGHLHDCVRVYKSVRKSFLDASFRRLGMEKLSADEVRRMEWGALEAKIRLWTRAAKICVIVLFDSEKRLCDQIFGGLGIATADACFAEMFKDRAVQLFNFAEAVANIRRSPERLFRILDLHTTLSELSSNIEVIFLSESMESILIQAAGILAQLEDAARGILSEFENAVLHELSDNLDRGGRIYPLTTFVINYITQIASYKKSLTQLIKPLKEEDMRYFKEYLTGAELERRTPLAVHLIWIIYILQFQLVCKSKHYEDASLAQLFMINNVHYIVQKVEESPVLLEMIGDDYVEKLTENVRQAVIGYQKSTWDRIFHCLTADSSRPRVSKRALGERAKSFNAMFEEVHQSQATWFVPDLQLREDIRLSVLEVLIPAYRSFLGRLDSHLGRGKQREEFIKYSVEDLETLVSNLFEGRPYTTTLRSQ